MPLDDDDVPELTVDDVRRALRESAPRAQRLLEELERDHLRATSAAMALRLD
jgi:hypothetical protein